MKKLLVMLLLVFAAAAYGQQPVAPPSSQVGEAPSQPASQKQPQKTIKDPAEYNAYIAAIQTQAPAQRATALESFLQSYPNTVMKEDSAELLLATYQQLLSTDPQKYTQKVIDTAQRLLQINPNNLKALAVLSYMNSALAQGGGPNAEQMIQQASQYGERGLQQLQAQTTPPEGLTEQQWTQQKATFRAVFLGAMGQAALQRKDYASAQQDFKQLVAADPNDFSNVYLLAVSYLEANPPVPDGLFWIARAVALAPAAQLQGIQRYGRLKYDRYHGSDEGWDQLLATAKTTPSEPPNFTVTSAPSPAEQARLMLQKSSPEKLSFGEWQFILSSGNQQAADQVWNAIKGKSVKMVAQVISASPKALQVAGSEDDIDAKKPDIELNLATPLTLARVPKPGTQITFQGVLESYTPSPFMMRMTDGAVLSRSTPETSTPRHQTRP